MNIVRAGEVLFHSFLAGGQILGDYLLGLEEGTVADDTVLFLLILMDMDGMSGASAITLQPGRVLTLKAGCEV